MVLMLKDSAKPGNRYRLKKASRALFNGVDTPEVEVVKEVEDLFTEKGSVLENYLFRQFLENGTKGADTILLVKDSEGNEELVAESELDIPLVPKYAKTRRKKPEGVVTEENKEEEGEEEEDLEEDSDLEEDEPEDTEKEKN